MLTFLPQTDDSVGGRRKEVLTAPVHPWSRKLITLYDALPSEARLGGRIGIVERPRP